MIEVSADPFSKLVTIQGLGDYSSQICRESDSPDLRRHLPATLGTGSAGPNAGVHVADPFAVIGAIFANIGAFGAEMLVMGRADDHDLRGSAAGLRTGQHQLDMGRLGMLATQLKAVSGAHAETDLVTAQALVDASLHRSFDMVHRRPRIVRATD
jgi:hypothetical protein